jgi:hypothetical protein
MQPPKFMLKNPLPPSVTLMNAPPELSVLKMQAPHAVPTLESLATPGTLFVCQVLHAVVPPLSPQALMNEVMSACAQAPECAVDAG